MATWVFSMDATMTMTGDLKKMCGSEEVVQLTHKEESPSRINWDGDDRQSLRRTLLSCINPTDPSSRYPCDRISAKHLEWSGSPTKL